MHQILFRLPEFLPWIGGMPIYGYGVMLVIGFFAAMELARFLARRSGMDPELFSNAALIALVAGVAGARLSHVIENWGDYTRPDLSFWQNLWNAVNIRSGGLTYYGGFILGFISVLAYGLYKKAPIRLGMDIIAPCLMVGLGFGRIGCYLNGCCYGAECDVPWAVKFGEFPYHSDAYVKEFEDNQLHEAVPRELLRPDTALVQYLDAHGQRDLQEPLPADVAGRLLGGSSSLLKGPDEVSAEHLQSLAADQHSNPVHPAQWYSTITAWLIAAFLVAYFTLPHAPGRVFALMLIVEGVSRFLLETVRAEPPVIGNWSLSMVLSVPLVALGIVLWVVFGSRRVWKDREGGSIRQPVGAAVPG